MTNQVKIFKVETAGDCEWRTSETVGYFIANNAKEVAEYLVVNKITPSYYFVIKEVKCYNVIGIEQRYVKSVLVDKYGKLEINTYVDELGNLKKLQDAKSGLEKLTQDERKALGLEQGELNMSMSDFFVGTMDSPVIERETFTENKPKPLSAKQAKEEMDKNIINYVNSNIEQAIKGNKYSFVIDMGQFSNEAIDRVIDLYHDYDIDMAYTNLYFTIK